MKKKYQFEDDEFYVNDAGLYVFTEAYLLQRGYCCGNGCIHCPYDFKNVVDLERKAKLLANRRSQPYELALKDQDKEMNDESKDK